MTKWNATVAARNRRNLGSPGAILLNDSRKAPSIKGVVLLGRFNRRERMPGIGDLTGGIAHDFNNMLMVMAGYAERARKHLGERDAVAIATDDGVCVDLMLSDIVMPKFADTRVTQLHILIVDDNLNARNLMRGVILDFGVSRACFAKSTDEAGSYLDATRENDAVDVILCGWNMSGTTGIEFLRHIRSCKPELPFIMITGNAGVDALSEARRHGVTSYIVRPFSSGMLYRKPEIVAQLLAKRRRGAPAG